MGNRELIEVFDCEMQCEYRGRVYLVRENGAICRVSKDGVRRTKWDDVWTFGDKNKDGYMVHASSVRVHQVVCSAFYGPAPQPNMVVDHIDTNRSNNRPDNLRWVTRLENALGNPATRKKIVYYCGSVEAFLDNPEILRTKALPKDISWMRAVTKEEANACKKYVEKWAAQDSKSTYKETDALKYEFPKDYIQEAMKYNGTSFKTESFQNYKEDYNIVEEKQKEEDEKPINSLTPLAMQLNWKIPSEFPLCPQEITSTPLQDYLSRLSKGVVCVRNKYVESIVLDADIALDGSHISIAVEIQNIKPYALMEVFYEDGIFVHKSIRTFFERAGVEKHFNLSLGKEWTGGDVGDDYC